MSEPTPDEEELMTRDALDDLLDASAPAPTLDKRDVRAMVADARREVRVAPRAKRAAAITGVLALLMAGGAGVATAADYFDWAPWAQDPVGAYTYELPSGAACEVRFGNVQIVDRKDRDRREEIEQDLREWFNGTDVAGAALADVNDYIADSRAGEHKMQLEDGSQVPAGYGTPYYDADLEYQAALSQSIDDKVMAESERLGYADEIASLEGHGYCPELDQ